MAIDIRANVTCSLGDLISGSIGDDYIQGNGLVKTKGSCELNGILTPKPGTVVTFSYSRGGSAKQIPRKLRVLSSFADPFRNTTKVELGCKLTYLEGLAPMPLDDEGQKAELDARRQHCLNGYVDYPPNSEVPYPINASAVMNECLQKLKITASSVPLTNVFMIDKFDLSAGYVEVLSDLLLSESYFGYLDANETLQVVSLSGDGGKGPNIDATALIDLGPIGVGDLPAETVLVRYEGLKLDREMELSNLDTRNLRNWEEEETVGDPEKYPLRYTTTSGATAELTFGLIPYSKTVTQYGVNNSWDDTKCYIYGTEGADLSDKPIKRTTTTRVLKAQAAGNYCAQVLAVGFDPNPSHVGEQRSETEYEYDAKGELKRTVESTYQPFYMWAGGLDVDFVYSDANGVPDVVTLGAADVLTEKVITEYENIYAQRPAVVYLQAGEEYEPEIAGQKVTTTRYLNWALTQQGQQTIASIKDDAAFANAQECANWLIANSRKLVQDDCQVQTNRGRTVAGGQIRPSKADRAINANGQPPVEAVGKLAFATGSPVSDRALVLSMPYQSQPYFSASGQIIQGDAEAKALLFGRCQNRLLAGNRNGASVQVHPDKLPAAPFKPFYLTIGNLAVQYRANALNWAFSSDGIVASMDALCWGVAGGTGTPWVPVAPGVTTFPPLPVSDADGNVDVTTIVPPWNETVPLVGRTRTLLLVKDYAYAIGGTTETAALVTRTKLVVGYRLAADAGSFALTGTAQPIKLRAGAGSFVLSGLPAGSLGNRVWRVNGTTFNVLGQDARLVRNYAPLAADAGSFVLDGKPAGKFKGTSMKADVGSFTVSGGDAGRSRSYLLSAGPAAFSFNGRSANIGVSDPYFSSVVLLLHMNGTDGSTNFVDSSSSSKTVTAYGGAAISTAQSKFNGSSGSFDGANTYLLADDSPDWYLGTGEFTIEAFIRLTTQATTATIAAQRGTDTNAHAWSFTASNVSGGQLQFRYTTSGSSVVVRNPTWVPTLGTWHHVCVCRAAGTLRLFADGAVINSVANSVDIFNSPKPLMIGAGNNNTTTTVPINFLHGHIQDLRITKGVGRYAANFTPPTRPFPDF